MPRCRGAERDRPLQERARPGAGDEVQDLGDVVGPERYRLGGGLGPQGRVDELDAHAAADHLPGVGHLLDRFDPYDGPRTDECVQAGPGRWVLGVGEGGEGGEVVDVVRVAGGSADALGEVGVRAVERRPHGVVEDGGVGCGQGPACTDVGLMDHGGGVLS